MCCCPCSHFAVLTTISRRNNLSAPLAHPHRLMECFRVRGAEGVHKFSSVFFFPINIWATGVKWGMGWVVVGTAIFGASRFWAKILENTVFEFFTKMCKTKTAVPTTTHPIPHLPPSKFGRRTEQARVQFDPQVGPRVASRVANFKASTEKNADEKCPLEWSGFTCPIFTCSVPRLTFRARLRGRN